MDVSVFLEESRKRKEGSGDKKRRADRIRTPPPCEIPEPAQRELCGDCVCFQAGRVVSAGRASFLFSLSKVSDRKARMRLDSIRRWWPAAATTLFLLHGCAMPGKDAWDASVAKSQTSLRERASFDLSCPVGELQVQSLEEKTDQWGGKYMSTAGVAGCGRNATYIAHGDFQWLNNAGASASTTK